MSVEIVMLAVGFAVALFLVMRWLGIRPTPWPEYLGGAAIYIAVTFALWNSGIDRFIVTLIGVAASWLAVAGWNRLARKSVRP